MGTLSFRKGHLAETPLVRDRSGVVFASGVRVNVHVLFHRRSKQRSIEGRVVGSGKLEGWIWSLVDRQRNHWNVSISGTLAVLSSSASSLGVFVVELIAGLEDRDECLGIEELVLQDAVVLQVTNCREQQINCHHVVDGVLHPLVNGFAEGSRIEVVAKGGDQLANSPDGDLVGRSKFVQGRSPCL